MNYKDYQKNFCKNLKKKMDEHGYSQRTLGEAVGVYRSNISFYLNGKFWPSIPVFVRLCEVLETSIDELLGAKSGKKEKQKTRKESRN